MEKKKFSMIETIENGKVKYASDLWSRVIIEERRPLGKFYAIENGTYIGIDNEYGHAWVEEFEKLTDCVKWLIGEEE